MIEQLIFIGSGIDQDDIENGSGLIIHPQTTPHLHQKAETITRRLSQTYEEESKEDNFEKHESHSSSSKRRFVPHRRNKPRRVTGNVLEDTPSQVNR